MSTSKNIKNPNFGLYLGYIFILLSIAIIWNIFGPVVEEEIKYTWRQTVYEDQSLSPHPCPKSDFTISIDKLGICSQIIPDVDPFDSNLYQIALSQGVAHAKGTGMPGQGKNIFLFAHSSGNPLDASRYNSIFYLLYKLTKDEIIVLNYQNISKQYQIVDSKIVTSTSVNYLIDDNNEETLTLMTCWPPGTTLNRLIVIAKPIY